MFAPCAATLPNPHVPLNPNGQFAQQLGQASQRIRQIDASRYFAGRELGLLTLLPTSTTADSSNDRAC